MGDRKRFLVALAASGTLLARRGRAADATATAPDGVRTEASAMRRFDPTLDERSIRAIADGIAAARRETRALRSAAPALSAADEPVTTFAVRER